MRVNVAAHNVSMRNIKVSKGERHIQRHKTYIRFLNFTLCNSISFVTLYVIWRLFFETLHFGTLTLCAATFCNLTSCDVYVIFCFTLCRNIKKRVVRRTVPNLVTLSLLIIQFDKTVVPYAEEIDELALRRDSSTTPPPPAPPTGSTLLSRQLVIPTSPRELIQRKK